jgi:hypothetical protein
MAKHTDGFPGISFGSLRGQAKALSIAALVCMAVSAYGASAEQMATPCLSISQNQVDSIFNQAFSTVSTISEAAVHAKERGAWKPDGTFRKRFFSQAGRSLSVIKSLLTVSNGQAGACSASAQNVCITSQVPKQELLEAFEDIVSIPLPRGLRSLKRLQRLERENFKSKLDTLPASYITCKG